MQRDGILEVQHIQAMICKQKPHPPTSINYGLDKTKSWFQDGNQVDVSCIRTQ